MESVTSPASLSLLIIDDDTVTCEVIGRIIALKFSAITVYTADSGRIGLELCKMHKPGIVITDITMPDMDGFQVAKEIKLIKADTQFIVLTGNSDENYLTMFREIGFADYMVKPINFGRMFATIEKCCAEILLQQK